MHMSAFEGKADMTIGTCPLSWSLSGVKQTSFVAAHMSAYDPKRTPKCYWAVRHSDTSPKFSGLWDAFPLHKVQNRTGGEATVGGRYEVQRSSFDNARHRSRVGRVGRPPPRRLPSSPIAAPTWRRSQTPSTNSGRRWATRTTPTTRGRFPVAGAKSTGTAVVRP